LIDEAYVSPLKRARDTMEIILKDRELEAVITDNLREINLGPWEGKTRKETALSHPDEYMAFWEKPDAFNLPGADTFIELQQRVVEELESIFLKGNNKNILVVSHWIAIKVALAHYSSTSLSHLSGIADPVNGSFLRLSKRDNDVFIHQ
jgi:broad specificity phosphatase PhoE